MLTSLQCRLLCGVERSASGSPVRRLPLQTVRADFPHTASLVRLVSLVSLPSATRHSFTLIPTDAPRPARAVCDAPHPCGLSPLVGLSTITFFSASNSHRLVLQVEALCTPARASLRDSPSARGIPTGIAPLPRYYGLVRLLRTLSRRRSPKFPMQLSRRAAPLCPAMLFAPQIDSDASFRLHAE